MKALLRSIEKYLPIGGLEWDTVVSEHKGLFPLEQRTKEALKRKFAALHNKRMGTGDPHIPDSVRYAKRIIEAIKNKADISDGEDYDKEEVPSDVQDASAHIIDTRVQAPLIVQATVLVEQFDDPSDINAPFGAGATVATALVTMAGRHDEQPEDDTGEAGTGSILVSSTGNHNRLVVRAGSTSTAFSRGPGARSFIAMGSKKQAEAANYGGMTKILEYMQASKDTAERARKREFDTAERARKEELALIREQMQSSNMIMMQIMASITGGRQNDDRKQKSARKVNNKFDYDYTTPVPNIRRQDVGPRRGRDEYSNDDDDSDDSSEVVSELFDDDDDSDDSSEVEYLATTRSMIPTYSRRSTKRQTPDVRRIPTTVLFEHQRRRVDAVDNDDKKQKATRMSVVDDDVDDALLEASFTAYLKRRKVNEELFLEQEEGNNYVADSSTVAKVKAAGTGTQGTTTSSLGALPETQAMLLNLAAVCPSPASATTSSSSSGTSKKMTASYAEAYRLAVEGRKVYDSLDSFENEMDPRVQEHRRHALRRCELGCDCLPLPIPGVTRILFWKTRNAILNRRRQQRKVLLLTGTMSRE